jgi:hypothetical protein
MFHTNGGLHLRCVTSDEYKRIWNYEIAELALALQENEGWKTPPARPCGVEGVPVRIATADDVLRNSSHPGLGIEVGDKISPAGLYASDHDCFIFQVNEDRIPHTADVIFTRYIGTVGHPTPYGEHDEAIQANR